MGLENNSNINSLLQDAYQNHWQAHKPFVWVLVNQKLLEKLLVVYFSSKSFNQESIVPLFMPSSISFASFSSV